MAACTSRPALLMSRFKSNIKEIRVDPSELREVICANPEIAPNDCSSGVATLEAIVSGLAPGRLAVTVIMGKSICGNGATGKKRRANTPIAIMARQIRVLATGRKIKTLKILTTAALLVHSGVAVSSGQKRDKPPVWYTRSIADYTATHPPSPNPAAAVTRHRQLEQTSKAGH